MHRNPGASCAQNQTDKIGDTTMLADPTAVDVLVKGKQ
jgi:hypothetical protein